MGEVPESVSDLHRATQNGREFIWEHGDRRLYIAGGKFSGWTFEVYGDERKPNLLENTGELTADVARSVIQHGELEEVEDP